MALNFKHLWAQMSGLTPQENELIAQFEKEPKATTCVASSDILRKRGYLDESIVLLEDTVRRFPNYIAARVALGRDYYSRGLFPEAQREIEFAITSAVENLMAQRLQLKLSLLNNDVPKIKQAMDMLRTLTPMDDFTRAASEYVGLGDFSSARNMVLAELRRLGVTPPEGPSTPNNEKSLKVPERSHPFQRSSDTQSQTMPSVSAQNPSVAGWQLPEASTLHEGRASGESQKIAISDSSNRNFSSKGISVQPPLFDNSGIFPDLPAWINEQVLPIAFTPGSSLGHVRGDLDRYLQLRAFKLITSPEAFSRKRALQQAYSLESTTLADIYASQGHYDRAIAIYERLLKDNPTLLSAQQKLSSLQTEARKAAAERFGSATGPSKPLNAAQVASQAERERKLKFLEALLKKMEDRVTSPTPQSTSPEWPEANSGEMQK